MKKVVMIIAVLAIATAAQAAVVATHDGGTQTVTVGGGPDMSGYTTYQVTLTTDTGDLTGFEVVLTADAASQVNPLGNASIFEDANGFFGFVDYDESADTQFNFVLNDVTLVSSSEATSGTVLAGTFALAGGTGSPLAAASINVLDVCLPTGNTAVLSGKVTVGLTEVIFSDFTIPEPASLALMGMGGISMLIRRKR